MNSYCTQGDKEIKAGTGMVKYAFNTKKKLPFSKMALRLRKRPVKCYVWSRLCCFMTVNEKIGLQKEAFEM